jgi:hypothetical protein
MVILLNTNLSRRFFIFIIGKEIIEKKEKRIKMILDRTTVYTIYTHYTAGEPRGECGRREFVLLCRSGYSVRQQSRR